MKKTLIALAALGAMVGAAHAQSSVTLYGILDIGLMKADSINNKSWSIESGNVSGSRWGLKGSEDLGGGLKANFVLEQGFRLDTGAAAAAGQAFSRQSYVGLSGGWGEVQIGKPWTAYDDVSGAINAMWDSTWSVENNFFRSTGYSANPGNTLKYITPSFGGFTASASYTLDENKTTDLNVGSLSLAYANGPLAVGFGYQVEGQGPADDIKHTRLSASYDFGAVVLKGLYGNSKNIDGFGTGKTDEYSIGVDVPVGGAFTLSAAYGYSKDKNFNAAVGNEKRKGFTLGGMYALSKRTEFFAGVTDWEGKISGVKTSEDTKYGVSIRHRF